MAVTAGLDVGGAHLKVALADGARLVAVEQYVCPLWQGLDRLDAALAAASPLLARADRVAATMTGELSDLFASRREGVETLVARLVAAFGEDTRFWMGPRGFGSGLAATAHPADTGSTNFLATASLVAGRAADALVVDFGSTTTDIVPIIGGAPAPRGFTDAERQATGELVYTGFTRTAVMAVADRVAIDGRWVTLAREYLATMADVRRILGVDLDEVDHHATADGKSKSVADSIQRLARMTGRDGGDARAATWRLVAEHVRAQQLASIEDGARQVLSAALVTPEVPVVAAGIGAEEVAEIARRLARPSVSFGDLAGCDGALARHATWSAPAAAVALLAAAE